MTRRFMTASDVGEDCGISISKAYKVIRTLNAELKAKGYIVFRGRVPRKYYYERTYGEMEEN